ncbi:MAG: zinc-dependent metalloprotease [Phycisphaerales bacterium]|nr:zinc-dependent metalloprotease [Phycisphaerales bacterium]
MLERNWSVSGLSAALVVGLILPAPARGQDSKPEFPPFDQVSKDFERVISTADDSKALYTLYLNKKKNEMLAGLPANFEGQRIFIATSIAGGSRQTGYQWGDMYCYWTRLDDQLILMEPNLLRQARGGPQDAELQAAVKRTYSDRVVTSAKILTMGPNRGPVIDLDDLLIKNSQVFMGMKGNASLAKLGQVKAFPENVEIPVTLPMGDGEMTTLHYSISVIPKTDYKPQEADERIGYFLTVYKDFTKNEAGGDQFVRNINRWNLQKRDPKLKLSPPVQPIVFYIEHTVPVRYRRYIRDGILEWNKAFEKVGIVDAMEVRQQDSRTGAFMDIDPEDVRYNFFRWISSERAFAMGPSRVNPETGEILDADIIFDDSMLKLWATRYKDMIEAYGLAGLDPAALKFMEERPLWNPITRFEKPDPLRDEILNDQTLTPQQKAEYLGEPLACVHQPRLLSRVAQQNHVCDFELGYAMQMQTANLAFQLFSAEYFGADGETPTLDGVPEEYLGAMLKYVTSHEVGHTLGLRHNFKASSWLTLNEYAARKGEANIGSVMDYAPPYLPADPSAPRGDWASPTVGPYDIWAIEYGYTMDDNRRKELLKDVAQPQLVYGTDEDRAGPDPLTEVWDLGAEPLDWATTRLALVKLMRTKLLDKAVTDGQSWHLLRRGYEQLLGEQLGALRIASRYVGGVHVNRDRKGDPNGREPLVPVAAEKQRTAMKFVIDSAFTDAAFDLRPDVLTKLASDKNTHWGNYGGWDPAFSIHDRVMQVQSFALLYLMNPGTLGRVYDNELRTPVANDALTLPELIGAVVDAVYTELDVKLDGNTWTNRQPMVSSLRRNLQSDLTERLVDLALNPAGMPRPIQTLSLLHLRKLNSKLDALLAKGAGSGQIDEYTLAHLADLNDRVDKALGAVQTIR